MSPSEAPRPSWQWSWPTPSWQLAAAACCTLILLSGAVYWGAHAYFTGEQPKQLAHTPLLASVTEYKTAIGQTSIITLPDGSKLTLDTGSSVRVTYSQTERGVYLLNGRAAFDVAKYQKRPFIVHAGERRVTATGTSFDVDKDPKRIEVTLVEGRVVVDSNATSAGQLRTTLTPGKRLVARPGVPDSVQDINLAQAEAWRNGHLSFDNKRLAEVIEEMNRYSTKRIILADASLQNIRIGGVFRTGKPIEMVEGLQQIYPISHDTDAAGNIVVHLTPNAGKHFPH